MSQATNHARYADWDGAYVLGALSPSERREYEKHLEQCERCRASVAELTSMPGLLARLGPDRAQALLDDPLLDGFGDSIFEDDDAVGAVAAVARPRAARGSPSLAAPRPHHRRPRGGRGGHRGRDRGAPAARPVGGAHAADTRARGGRGCPVERLGDPHSRGVGHPTRTRVQLRGIHGGGAGTAWSYGLYVTEDDGTTSELSTWKITPGSKAQISAATELALADIHTVEIRPIGSDEVLLRATVEN